MFWIILAIIAYFIQAIVSATDKIILTKSLPNPISYVFWVGVFSIFNIFFLWISWDYPGIRWLLMDFLVGVVWMVATLSLYKMVKEHETSRVVTITGAFIPLFTLILSYIFLNEGYTTRQLFAFAFLLLGSILLSFKKSRFYKVREFFKRIHSVIFKEEDILTKQLFFGSVVTAVFFAVYFIMTKFVFSYQPFLSAYAWTRIGAVLAALCLLFYPRYWRLIFEKPKSSKKTAAGLFVANKVLGGISFILINLAISLGAVAIINAMQGIQFVFLLIIVILLSVKYPKILKEEITKETLAQKISGIVLVGIGLFILLV